MQTFSYFLRNDKRLEVFFSSLDKKKEYLLALSGGSDSLFLLYLLKSMGITFVAAHVNHGWRSSAGEEACWLQSLCTQEGIPCIVDHAPSKLFESSRNMEDTARQYRYAWFHSLCTKSQLSGIFLAHHANDQAETILKRVLESAHLYNLRGMSYELEYQGVPLFRPLLHLPKKKLIDVLRTLGIRFIEDETNRDERYLRARMRQKLFPWIEEIFGKNIVAPLLTLSEDSKELAQYLHQQAQPFLANICDQEDAVCLPMPEELMKQPFLAKFVCKEFFRRAGFTVTRHFIQTVYSGISKGTVGVLRLRDQKIVLHNRAIKLIKENLNNISDF